MSSKKPSTWKTFDIHRECPEKPSTWKTFDIPQECPKKDFPLEKLLTFTENILLDPLIWKTKNKNNSLPVPFFKGEGPTNQEEKIYDIVNKQGFNKKSFSTCLVYPKQKITFHLFYYLSSYSEK